MRIYETDAIESILQKFLTMKRKRSTDINSFIDPSFFSFKILCAK